MSRGPRFVVGAVAGAVVTVLTLWASIEYYRWVHRPPDQTTQTYRGAMGQFDVGLVAAILAVITLIGVPYLRWLRARWKADEPGPTDLKQAADRLAGNVEAQWSAEVARWDLMDPELSVSWRAAPAELFEDWQKLLDNRSAVARWPGEPGTPAASADELAGRGDELLARWKKVPTGRLVLLGDPGSGKTMLLARLVLDLLGQRVDGGPVPVMVSVASWDPKRTTLIDWLAWRLTVDHAWLDRRVRGADEDTQSLAEVLLRARRIIVLLDGFDEIPKDVRGAVVARLGAAALPAGQPLILSSRIDEFRAAVEAQPSGHAKLFATAGVAMNPLEPDAVIAYLRDSAGSEPERWDGVAEKVGNRSPALSEALTTPLIAMLARTVYNPPRGAELDGPRPMRDPDELTRGRSAPEVRDYLFDTYVRESFRRVRHGKRRRRWNPEKAERWLQTLAVHLQRDEGGRPDFAWWRLRTPPREPEADGPLVVNAALALAVVTGTAVWLTLAFVFTSESRGFYTGFLTAVAAAATCVAIFRLTRSVAAGVRAGLATGLTAGFAAAVVADLASPPEVGVSFAIATGFAVGLSWPPYVPRRRLTGMAVRTGVAMTAAMTAAYVFLEFVDLDGVRQPDLLFVLDRTISMLPQGVPCGISAALVTALGPRLTRGLGDPAGQPVRQTRWPVAGLAVGGTVAAAIGSAFFLDRAWDIWDADQPGQWGDAALRAAVFGIDWGIAAGLIAGLGALLIAAIRNPGLLARRSTALYATLGAAVTASVVVGTLYLVGGGVIADDISWSGYSSEFAFSGEAAAPLSIAIASGLVVGLVTGLVVELARAWNGLAPANRFGGLGAGLLIGVVLGGTYWFTGSAWQGFQFGVTSGVATGIVVGFAAVLLRPVRAAAHRRRRAPSSRIVAGTVGTAFVTVLFGIVYGFTHGIAAGLGAVLITILMGRLDTEPLPARTLEPDGTGFVIAASAGVLALLVVGFNFDMRVGLLAAVLIAVCIGAAYGFHGEPHEQSSPESPARVLAQDRLVFVVAMAIVALVLPVAIAVIVDAMFDPGRASDVPYGIRATLIYGLIIGPIAAAGQAAWGRYLVVRCALALTGRLPWRLMTFLADAHIQHGVLRQSGAYYQFRHISLQRRLARVPPPPSPEPVTAPVTG
ncbi:hypothetical protein FB565_003130 [Actinoplanes lutulentus]|uniref:NACHT domain-containing protein n=1 Tax=Actinoplanes lutulentus TaxID=1287878 RepID=A0A327Z0N6_9ACTN|nr:NACHT domain-containing protein [Actinoplanes lutulentus]MBB2943417.1 hypothetical protein [Actinoplanes lutulentus]RAK26064.1 NACHT domain-containing protein [Actinoplanes lutulentus]